MLVLLVAASVGLPMLLAHLLLSRQQNARHAASDEALLAVALGVHLEAASGTVPDCDEWIERLAEEGGRVRWGGVFDENGEGLEFRRRTSMRCEDIVAQIPFEAERPVLRPLTVGGHPSQQFFLLSIPQAEPGKTLAAVLDLGADMPTSGPLILVGLACAGLVGLAAAFAWLHYAIQRPIQGLDRWVTALHHGLSEAALEHVPPDELRKLVCSVREVQREVQRWRAEAGQLRHSLDLRVDAKTRKMTQALRQSTRDADTDLLTGLCNRRALLRDFPTLFDEQRAVERELTAVLINVDGFKRLNDTHGHSAGDELLVFLGELIRATIRKRTDLAVRYGGDEFLLLLPDCDAVEATTIARRLRSLFSQRARTLDRIDPPLDLSAGIAGMQQHRAGSWQKLLELADAAMYHAKEQRLGVATVDDARARKQRPVPPMHHR